MTQWQGAVPSQPQALQPAPATRLADCVRQAHSRVTLVQAIYRKDYKPTPFLVDQVYLNFILGDEVTRVQSKLSLKPNYSGSDVPELALDGAALALLIKHLEALKKLLDICSEQA